MPPTTPAVQCSECRFAWHSQTMADGLRLLPSCPRCGTGALVFRDAAGASPATGGQDQDRHGDPHRVLGLPRR